MKILTLVLSLGLLLAALACAAPVPTPIPTATPDIPATVTARIAALPTATPYPTLTPWPTATPRPTVTPYPTPTAVPTATPYPTSTPYPTPTALPTYTPYPTATPDIRYQVVTPTPEPTPGPLASWQVHSPRSTYTIHLPGELSKSIDLPSNSEQWGQVLFNTPNDRVQIIIEDAPNWRVNDDLFRISGWWLEFFDGYTIDILSFQELSDTVLRGAYRLTNHPGGYCDVRYYALFVRGETHTYQVAVGVCESVRWKYDAEFADRVLNSFTY